MKMYLTNQTLLNFAILIGNFKGRGKSGRALAKFNKTLTERSQEYADYEMEIVEKYAERDENGETTTKWQEGKEVTGNQELEELRNDEILIDLTEFETYLQPLIEGLYDNDDKLEMEQLIVFDELLEKLENL